MQPRISDLRRGRLDRFSLERLILMAVKLGGEVTLQVDFGRRTPFTAAGREQQLRSGAAAAVRHRVEVADHTLTSAVRTLVRDRTQRPQLGLFQSENRGLTTPSGTPKSRVSAPSRAGNDSRPRNRPGVLAASPFLAIFSPPNRDPTIPIHIPNPHEMRRVVRGAHHEVEGFLHSCPQ